MTAGMTLLGYGRTVDAFRDARDLLGQEVVFTVGTDVEYSVFVEFGTSRMAAQPYLFPAARRVARDPGRYIGEVESTEAAIRKTALAIESIAKDLVPVDTGNLKGSIRAERVS